MNIIDKETEKAREEAKHFGIEFVTLRGMEISRDTLYLINEDVARKNQLVVYKKEDKHIYIAVSDPKRLSEKAPEILTKLKQDGYNFTISMTTPSDLNYALLGYKQKGKTRIKTPQKPPSSQPLENINLEALKISPEILKRIPKKIAQKYRLIVFEESPDGALIKIALEDPDNLQTQELIDYIKTKNKIDIKQYHANASGIDRAILQYPEEKKENLVQKKSSSLEKSDENISKILAEKIRKGKEENQKNTAEIPKISIKNEPPKPVLEKTAPKIQVAQVHEESKVPVSFQAINMAEDKTNEIVQKKELTVVASIEEEQNLDKIIPGGVKNITGLVEIIKAGFIPKIVAAIIYLAQKMEASDVHIEEDVKNMRLRYRIDGVLRDIAELPSFLHAPIVSRIKILSKLKIDEQRIPQDGRFDVLVDTRQIDIRVSTLPTIHGEKCVMRLLDKTTGLIDLEKLGLIGTNLQKVKDAIAKPFGIIYVTGPTGSGKTTTLYAILKRLDTEKVNIVTLEDPVEYELPGINQCQIKPKIGFGFAEGLRSILRQDPNIIMVGEIRDGETANMATHAALTGHLVLSTLHTNDSSGAMPRLIDMGVEPYLITSSINAVIGQRLVRKLCDKCRKPTILPERLMTEIKNELNEAHDPEIKKLLNHELKFYKPGSCNECKDGYKGRISLFEVLTVTERIEQLTINRATSSIIKRAALNQGMVTIRQDGFAKALQGLTSIDEVIRVTSK